MEADFVTGPAKNLIEFGQRARPEVSLSVVAYLRGAQSETDFIRTARNAGLAVDIIQERGRFDTTVVGKLRELVKVRRADIVQTHNTKSHFFLRSSGIWRDYPWLAFHHGYTTPDMKMRVYDQTDRWSLRAARHLVTVCEPFVDQLVKRGIPRSRISVQHNSVKLPAPVTEADVQRVRAELNLKEGTPVLVSIGRLSNEKGHADLIEALPHLPEGLDFHLVIVGEGPERGRMEERIRSLKLASRVSLAGLQKDVRPYYAMANLVVLPSHSEGSPNVLLEAMIHGRAIVSTRVGGVPEIAKDEESALLVPPCDPAAMANAISRMLKDPVLRDRLGARAKEIAVTSYSPDGYCRSMIGLYKRLAGQQSSS